MLAPMPCQGETGAHLLGDERGSSFSAPSQACDYELWRQHCSQPQAAWAQVFNLELGRWCTHSPRAQPQIQILLARSELTSTSPADADV